MKIHPFFKSFIVIILFGIILFFAKEIILTQGSFRWAEDFDTTSINEVAQNIFYNNSLSFIISLSFTLPFLFFNKNRISTFLKWTISLSIFTWFTLLTIANGFGESSFIFTLIRLWSFQIMSYEIVLFTVIYPLGIFLITKIFLPVNYKLLLLLFLACPLAFSMDSLDLFAYILKIKTGSDFNIFFSLLLWLNIISNFYFRKFDFDLLNGNHEDILDAPDI